jgi:hypothetical protein
MNNNNSSNISSKDPQQSNRYDQHDKSQFVDFSLTAEQHLMIQNYLPRKYALL